MSQETSISRASSTARRSRLPLEFSMSLQLKQETTTSSLFQRPGGCQTWVLGAFWLLTVWIFFVFMEKKYVALRDGPPHNYWMKKHEFSNEPLGHMTETFTTCEGSHTSSWATPQLPPTPSYWGLSWGYASSLCFWPRMSGRTPLSNLSLGLPKHRGPRTVTTGIPTLGKPLQGGHVSIMQDLLT